MKIYLRREKWIKWIINPSFYYKIINVEWIIATSFELEGDSLARQQPCEATGSFHLPAGFR